MVDETNSLEEIRAYFAQDKFAAQAQCSIIEAAPNHAICEMPITVMGGAMFTLADFTMAIISNMDNKPTVAIDCTIRFFSPAKGEKLIATGSANKAGRTVGFYTVDITDDLGTNVAQFVCTAHRS